VVQDDTHAGAQHFCGLIEHLRLDGPPRVLAAGCGLGHEARYIHVRLGCEVVGIDADLPEGTACVEDGLTLMEASVLELPFPDASFDAVFYHHVIEHVPDAPRSLDELNRVLRPGGWLYVGTPNRHRAVGYLGSYDASLRQKIRWNLYDYRARLKGRFRNELGAHAGYSQDELRRLIAAANFTDHRSLTRDYLHFKYGERLPGPVMTAVADTPIRNVIAPGVYAVARRP
jgi:ubiquinone/menaquinone biosynthesis C-methylase UbiE